MVQDREQGRRLNRVSKLMFKGTPVGPRPKKCPNCKEGQLRKYDVVQVHPLTGVKFDLWCYVCGWKGRS